MQFLYMLVALLAVALLGGRVLLRAWFYPKPPVMEPVTHEPLHVQLERLDRWLREHAPAIADALRPGLSDDEIDALEAEGRLRLTEEMCALYRWHAGCDERRTDEFIPSHRFVPLGEAVRGRTAVREQVRSLTAAQRIVFAVFAGHRTGWLHVFSDGAGDGYFYDPQRRGSPGSFFFNFNEDHSYLFFPTLADFVAAVIECFESGAFRPSARGTRLRWDIEKSIEIMDRYGVANAV